ncbi:hypothetical protein CHL76_14045 [Marinococcus halophilus]|uniref:DUF4352 domain-containing protein n=1 Tax=Marinococcus halophilus TaxID=1371 RepID=A0A510Y8W3_MARHA|nr:DUF4352 domain-containing protein [Marinococcus halophilus]OZT79163.1 hypothetical protein CHL76_14045 [Marinococcus halophilus]GEK59822.1 hypothetical protein MHA01_27270 [Marinococcus halophilus]
MQKQIITMSTALLLSGGLLAGCGGNEEETPFSSQNYEGGEEQQDDREVNIMSPGDTATADGMDITIDSVEFTSSEENTNGDTNDLLAINVSATNTTQESKTLSQENFELFNESGYTRPVHRTGESIPATLSPNEEASGTIYYDAKEGNKFQIEYMSPSTEESTPVWEVPS